MGLNVLQQTEFLYNLVGEKLMLNMRVNLDRFFYCSDAYDMT